MASVHQTSGRWRLGVLLAFTTAIFWGLLPIALKGVLSSMDAITVSWYRFLFAAIVVGGYLVFFGPAIKFNALRGRVLLLALVSTAALCCNYIFYVVGLRYISPDTTQVVIQLAPMMLLLAGLWVFRERFSGVQWLGVALFFIGISLFFNLRLVEVFTSLTAYSTGVFWIFSAALAWTTYAIAQKQLLAHYPSNFIMLFIYFVGTLLMTGVADPAAIIFLNSRELWVLFFCCLNTLVAYGAFAEAMNHLEASRVSAIIATTPLFTMLFVRVLEKVMPGYLEIETINVWSIVGALFVVSGSMITALYRKTETSV